MGRHIVIFKEGTYYLDTLSVSDEDWSFAKIVEMASVWMSRYHWQNMTKIYHYGANTKKVIESDADLKDVSVVQVYVS